MVGLLYVGMDSQAIVGRRSLKPVTVSNIIDISRKNGLAIIAPLNDVLRYAGNYITRQSWHGQ